MSGAHKFFASYRLPSHKTGEGEANIKAELVIALAEKLFLVKIASSENGNVEHATITCAELCMRQAQIAIEVFGDYITDNLFKEE